MSIDKVVKELEMEMKASSGYSAERVSAFSRAIEIVKQGGYSKEDIELNRNAMYNKAIDDFANVLKENYDYLPQILSQESFGLYIDEHAEQLKAGVKE